MAIQVKKKLSVPEENYIYFHHTNLGIVIPVDPDTISDSTTANFQSSTPLSRSAPIYSYSNSGPRSVSVNFTIHRDLCNEYNNLGYDAVEALITNLDQMVLPDYNSAGKIVNPPLVSLKLRDDIFIKGVVNQSSHTYALPIVNYYGKNRYAVVTLNFGVTEVTPYSASIIANIGQYRDTSGISASSAVTSGIGNAISGLSGVTTGISGIVNSTASGVMDTVTNAVGNLLGSRVAAGISGNNSLVRNEALNQVQGLLSLNR